MKSLPAAIVAPALAGLAIAAAASIAVGGNAAAQGGIATPAGETVHVREVMQKQINPAILGVWDIGNNAMNDEGGIDPALMDDAKWASLEDAAARLAAAAQEMAAAGTIRAAHADRSAVTEGDVTMAKVQQLIDADPAGFRQAAIAQTNHAQQLVAAAAARDAAAAGPLVAEMDGVCESCHARYWYGE